MIMELSIINGNVAEFYRGERDRINSDSVVWKVLPERWAAVSGPWHD